MIIKGRIRVSLALACGLRTIGSFSAKEVLGYLPCSTSTIAGINGQATEQVQVMMFPSERMNELIDNNDKLAKALVAMAYSTNVFPAKQQLHEMSSVLEKNTNPTDLEYNYTPFTNMRLTNSLRRHLQLHPETFEKLSAAKMGKEVLGKVNSILSEVLSRNIKPMLTLMQWPVYENELRACLDKYYVINSREVAEMFVEYGFTCKDIDGIAKLLPANYVSPVLNWVNNNLIVEKMANGLLDAS